MPPEELLRHVRCRPFVPFRIVLSEGVAYPVYQPEQVMVGRREVLLGLARPGEQVCETMRSVDLTCILRVEPLDAAAKENAVRPDDLLTWLRAVPFRPFRLTLNSGRQYDIRHPEMVKVGRSTANIFHYAGDPLGPYEQQEMVSLLLVERLEPLDAAAATGDGAAGS